MQRDFVFKTTVGEEERKYKASIPTAGQLIQIENLKAVYSANNYGGINSSGTIGANYALDLIDMNAYLSILCPELIDDLKTKDLFAIDVFDLRVIKDDYDEQFVPWINDWQGALRKVNKKSSQSLNEENVETGQNSE